MLTVGPQGQVLPVFESSSLKSPLRIAGGRHDREVRAVVDVLALDLDAEEEEGLVAVLVEVGARDEDRAAEVAAGVLELALRPLACPCMVFERSLAWKW